MSRSDLLLRHMRPTRRRRISQRWSRAARSMSPSRTSSVAQEFYGRRFRRRAAVLIPRADSETIIEAGAGYRRRPSADARLRHRLGRAAADRSWPSARARTGSASTHRRPRSKSPTPTAVSTRAVRTAPRCFCATGTTPGWADDLGHFDLILANPPYVEDRADLAPSVREYEPAEALFAGPEGLDAYTRAYSPAFRAPRARGRGGGRDRRQRRPSTSRNSADAAGFSANCGATLQIGREPSSCD